MRQEEALIATSRVDSHGDMLLESALKGLVDSARTTYVPVIVNHDPRCPPLGRVVDARIEELEDGELGVIAVSELYEEGDELPFMSDREMPVSHFRSPSLQVVFDRTYRDPESQELLQALSADFGTPLGEEGKKALEPLSVLTIGLFVGFGAVATGFLNALGSDLYAVVKQRINELFRKKRGGYPEQLLKFDFSVQHPHGRLVKAEVIFTNPTEVEIEYAFGSMLHDLDRILPAALKIDDRVVRVVFEASIKGIALSYVVRSDAVPLFPAIEGDQGDRGNEERNNGRDTADPSSDSNVG